MLRKISAIIIIAGLIGIPGLSLSGEEKLFLIPGGFMTGDMYISLSKGQRVGYVLGVQDGLSLAMLLGGKYLKVKWVKSWAEGKSSLQLEAMFSKYLRDHPEQWHRHAHVLYFGMMAKYYLWSEYEKAHK